MRMVHSFCICLREDDVFRLSRCASYQVHIYLMRQSWRRTPRFLGISITLFVTSPNLLGPPKYSKDLLFGEWIFVVSFIPNRVSPVGASTSRRWVPIPPLYGEDHWTSIRPSFTDSPQIIVHSLSSNNPFVAYPQLSGEHLSSLC